jgi:Methylamine utilisation protein MauE
MEQPDSRQRASRIHSSAHDAFLPCGDSVQTRGIFSLTRAVRTFLQSYLDMILGAVLVLAGALKGQQLLTDPSAGRASGFPRELLIGASAFELAFGCWLLGGQYRRLTRWLALGWFTSLAAVALAQAVRGVASCACLGKLHTSPWFMFAFDVAAVVTLWMWVPPAPSSARFFALALFLSLLPASGLMSLTAVPSLEPLFLEIDMGDIAQGGQKQQMFQLRNDCGAFMEVAAIETSCPCASIHLERTAVPAGQFLAGNVMLDLRPKPDFVGDLAIEAKGLRRSGKAAFALVIRARVHSASPAHTGGSVIRE